MEEINGITFRDYACANANIVAGMSVEKVCKILGVEQPVWEATVEGWNNKMAELSHEDMTFYGEVFNNPKQGKFAEIDEAATPKNSLELVPDILAYAKIMAHTQVASENGIDTISLLENEYNMNLLDWTKVGQHYGNVLNSIGDDMEKHNTIHIPFTEANHKWVNHFKELYKESGANLADDIEF